MARSGVWTPGTTAALTFGRRSRRRSNWALSATTTVDADKSRAPTDIGSTNPIGASGSALDDGAVGRDAASGAHDHDVAENEVCGRDDDRQVAVDALGLIGEQGGKRFQRRARLGEGAGIR